MLARDLLRKPEQKAGRGSVETGRKAKRHVTSPASAEEILRAAGVTRRDVATARSVLRELGYHEAARRLSLLSSDYLAKPAAAAASKAR